jgi:hypothetical protein
MRNSTAPANNNGKHPRPCGARWKLATPVWLAMRPTRPTPNSNVLPVIREIQKRSGAIIILSPSTRAVF